MHVSHEYLSDKHVSLHLISFYMYKGYPQLTLSCDASIGNVFSALLSSYPMIGALDGWEESYICYMSILKNHFTVYNLH